MGDLEDYILSDISILKRVDEYSLYCTYMGFCPKLRTRYNSPIREKKVDRIPSFSVFESLIATREYWWKDSGTGESGEIFKFVKLLFNLPTYEQVYRKVDYDFNLGFGSKEVFIGEKIVLNLCPEKSFSYTIKVKRKDFTKEGINFWNSFGISLNTLKIFNVSQISYYALNDYVKYSSFGFCYLIYKGYKIYNPFDVLNKFRNDLTIKCLEGFSQLKFQTDTLIITKSYKDVMVLYELGYEAVAPPSETTVLPSQFLMYFEKRYKNIIILFDNDMKHSGHKYPYSKVYVPLESNTKDISDYRKMYGKEKTIKLLKEIFTTN